MKKIIVYILVALLLWLLIPSYTASYQRPTEPPPRSISVIIAENAKRYGVAETTLKKVISCESSFNENAVGDFGNSFGLVQIHLPSHPYITKVQALNKEFAIDFLAKNLSLGKGKMWTCYRNLVVN